MSSSSSAAMAPSHPSRRDNQSVHSVASNHSRGERSSHKQSHPAVESAVTRLLVAIKQLLEALTLWSQLSMTEEQVSDVYVRLGNDFNAAVAAFGQYNIDMSELISVPEDLRVILEQCLSEEPSVANLEVFLPTVRRIITGLLQGLRNKQSIYRRIVSERRHRSGDSQGHERTESRSSRTASGMSRVENGSNGYSRSSQHSRNVLDGEGGTMRSPTSSDRDSQSRRRTGSTRRKDPSHASQSSIQPPLPSDGDYFAGGFVHRTNGADEDPSRRSQADSRRLVAPIVEPTTSVRSEDERDEILYLGTPLAADIEDPNDKTLTPVQTPPAQPPVPPNVTRYSLTDKPMALPSFNVEEATPPNSNDNLSSMTNGMSPEISQDSPETAPIDAIQTPAMASSLAALKKSDTLERRASKRFSTYNISKMTGGGVRERTTSTRSANRRSMAADASSLTPGDLDVLTEVDESPSESPRRDPSRSKSNDRGALRRPRVPSPLHEEEAPPIPPLPSPSPVPEPPLSAQKTPTAASAETAKLPIPTFDQESPSESSTPGPSLLTVFLQVGRVVKKVVIEPGLSFSSLRVLFVDKFSYNPGQDNFPAIYIRDPSSGVMYELEDVDEVQDKCLLSLNIEPLDQIKQHIDSQMSGLMQELKELRSAVSNTQRASHTTAIVAHSFNDMSAPVDRPTDKQFQRIAHRLSRLVADDDRSYNPTLVPQMTGSTLQPQMTGSSMLSEASSRIVADLKTQFDEVQNLRRDLGVMRQLYTDFMGQTKESLTTLRAQTHTVRQLANSKVGGARAYIDSGKTKLDSCSQTVLTRVEGLQDIVEQLKGDVLKRFVSPKATVLQNANKEITEVAAELESLKEYINTVKPMWKKTWEEELQNIVEEQQFLSHQEEFLGDLLEDHKALVEVYGHVQKVISIRGAGAGKSRGFRPPPPDEGHTGLSTVMLEIRGAAVDPERRMRAIEANQKNREKELASKSDEFEEELKGFVGGKKLKLTGGAEEAERVRQRRNDLALKAMFNNSLTGSGGGDMASMMESSTMDSNSSP